MGFNKGLAFKKFEYQWEQDVNEMTRLGMKQEDIRAIYEYDRQVFNSYRRFEEHCDRTSVVDLIEYEEDFTVVNHFIDELSDSRLYFALKQLNTAELEFITLYAVKGYNITEIAEKYKKSKSTISEKKARIIKKIKNIYENPNKS